jgi:lysozyme
MNGELLDAVVPFLMRDEGLRRRPYRCTAGHLTIGYGTNLDAGLDDDEAMFLLEHRINKAISACLATFPWFAGLDAVRSQVVVMMTYQLGIEGVAAFKVMRAALEKRDFAAAADAMLDSKWARADSPARAYRLATAMRRGTWADTFQKGHTP